MCGLEEHGSGEPGPRSWVVLSVSKVDGVTPALALCTPPWSYAGSGWWEEVS